MQKLVDISKWNGTVNWSKVAAAGYHAIIRCGYGQPSKSQDDPYFMENWRGCVENGVPFGVYIYSYASTKAGAQGEAKHAIDLIEQAKAKYSGKMSYPLFIDLEESKYKDSADTVAKYFGEYCEDRGYKWGIYASYSWWNSVLSKYKSNTDCCKWVARWTDDKNKKPSFADIWQYTSDGTSPGVDGRCDLNYVYTNTNSQSKPTNNGNPSIKSVQKWCNEEYGFSQDVDGIDGTNTLKCLVKALQTELNKQFGKALSIDGIFGTKTYNACVNVYPGARGNLTKCIQGRLICLGYETGGFDGIYGAKTENAVRKVQKKANITVNGICGKNTCRALFT